MEKLALRNLTEIILVSGIMIRKRIQCTSKCFKAALLKTVQTWLMKELYVGLIPVFTRVWWAPCWKIVSGVTSGGVQFPLALSSGLHLFITRLWTDTSAAAKVFPMGAPAVVHNCTGLIWVRALTVHPVFDSRFTEQKGKEIMKRNLIETYRNVLTSVSPAPHSLTWSVSPPQGASPMPRPAVATFRVSARGWLVYSICLIHISFSNSEIHTWCHA